MPSGVDARIPEHHHGVTAVDNDIQGVRGLHLIEVVVFQKVGAKKGDGVREPMEVEVRGMVVRVQSDTWAMMFLEEPSGLAKLLQFLDGK